MVLVNRAGEVLRGTDSCDFFKLIKTKRKPIFYILDNVFLMTDTLVAVIVNKIFVRYKTNISSSFSNVT